MLDQPDADILASYDDLCHYGFGERDEDRELRDEEDGWRDQEEDENGD